MNNTIIGQNSGMDLSHEDNNLNESKFIFTEPSGIEMIRLSKDGFFYRGEKVEDIHNVYERFNEWLIGARVDKGLE